MGVGGTAADIMLSDRCITGPCEGLLPCTASV